MKAERDFTKNPLAPNDLSLVKNLFAYVKKFPALLSIALVCMLISDLLNTSYPFILKYGIDTPIKNKDLNGLTLTALVLAAALVLSFLFSTTFEIITKYMGQKVIYALRSDVLAKLAKLTNRYFDHTPTGRNLTYLTNDVEAVNQFISNSIVSIVGSLIKCIFILAFMLTINWRLTLFTLLASIPIFILATYFFRLSIRKGYRGVRQANSVMNTLLVESLTGLKEILLFNHRPKSLADFYHASYTYFRSFLRVVHSYSLYFPLIEVVTSVSMIGTLLFAHYALNSFVTIGELFAFFIYINLFFRPLLHLAEQFNTLQSAIAACERIFSFLHTPIEFASSTPRHPNLHVKGHIQFHNVTFGYDKSTPILKNISFAINAGEKIAIVGNTGAGKTTIISLLTRLYDVTTGKITLDGTNIKDFNLAQLRENIGTIPQNIFLFSGSFYDNIALARSVSPAQVQFAAHQALIHNVISAYPQTYQQNVLEEGKALSTGQKQLLSFARIFIHAPPIIVLDEATANIDSESEALIEQALDKLLANKTAIIIAHRLATIARADKIIVLQNGNLIDFGSHAYLLNSSPIYKKLYSLQRIEVDA